MANRQLNFDFPDVNLDKEKIGKTRFTITLPLDISIKVDIEREKSLHTKNDWILMAIKEKLNGEGDIKPFEHSIKQLENDIREIKEFILKK